MPGQRRFGGDAGRLEIADLTDQDHVGVGAESGRSPDAKVYPAFGLTWVCLIPATRYSIGSSTVTVFRLGTFSSLRVA